MGSALTITKTKETSHKQMTASQVPVIRFAQNFLVTALTVLMCGTSAARATPQLPDQDQQRSAAVSNAPAPDQSKNTAASTAPPTDQTKSSAAQSGQKKDSPDGQYIVEVTRIPIPDLSRISLSEKLTGKNLQTLHFPGGISEVYWLPKSSSIVYMARAHANSPVHLYLADAPTHLTRDLTPFANTNVQRFLISSTSDSLIAYLDLEQKGTFAPLLIDTKTGATLPLQSERSLNQALARMKHITTIETAPERQRTRVAVQTFAPAMTGKSFGRYTGSFVSAAAHPTKFSAQEKYTKRLSGSIEQRLLFLTPNDKCEDTLKPFTEDEKKMVNRAWKWICLNNPGMALRATHGSRLRIGRVSKKKTRGLFQSGASILEAQAHVNEIILTDDYFSEQEYDKYKIFSHELAHEVDVHQHLSLSKQWLSLVMSNISEVQTAYKFSQTHGIVELDDPGAKYFGLPSVYAAQNAQESLAEWTNAYIWGIKTPTKIREFIEQNIFDPDCQKEKTDQKVVRAFYASFEGRHTEAINLLRQVTAEDPDFLLAKSQLALAYTSNKNFKQALAISNDLIHKLEAEKLYSSEKAIFAALYCRHFDILCRLNRYTEAQIFLSKALSKDPHDEEALAAQKWMNQYHKQQKSLKKS